MRSSQVTLKSITHLVEELKKGNLTEAQKLYINLEKEYDVITDGIKRAM